MKLLMDYDAMKLSEANYPVPTDAVKILNEPPATPAEIHNICLLHGFTVKAFDMLTGSPGGWEVTVGSTNTRFVLPAHAGITWWIEQCETMGRRR